MTLDAGRTRMLGGVAGRPEQSGSLCRSWFVRFFEFGVSRLEQSEANRIVREK